MGAIALRLERTPLLCAGQGADQVIALAARRAGPRHRRRAGDAVPAAAQHRRRMESLAVECLVAANAMGLRASLYEVLSDIDRTPPDHLHGRLRALARGPCRTPPRRSPRSRDQLYEAGLEPLVLDGVERLFARTARHLEAARAQGGVEVEDSVPARLALEQLARQH